MPNPHGASDRELPEFLPLDPGRRIITQDELRVLRHLEDAYAVSRSQIRRQIRGGAAVEPGPLVPDMESLMTPMQRMVRRTEAESLPMAVLTFSELRLLAEFRSEGTFYPRQIREILERFEREGQRIFRADMEIMRRRGCWNVSRHLADRMTFGYHIRRARLLLRMHELGMANFAVGVLRHCGCQPERNGPDCVCPKVGFKPDHAPAGQSPNPDQCRGLRKSQNQRLHISFRVSVYGTGNNRGKGHYRSVFGGQGRHVGSGES